MILRSGKLIHNYSFALDLYFPIFITVTGPADSLLFGIPVQGLSKGIGLNLNLSILSFVWPKGWGYITLKKKMNFDKKKIMIIM